jgi:hypothetical protein
MNRERKSRIKSILTTISIAILLAIVFTSGICWLFFDKKLDSLFTHLDVHAKSGAIVVKTIVYISGIICLLTPMVILCSIYSLTKEHRSHRFKFAKKSSQWFSSLMRRSNSRPDFNVNDIDLFMKSELKKLQHELAERRSEYLSMYNGGPLFLTETRDRFKNKMSDLLDYQDELIMYMHAELQVNIATKIRSCKTLTKDELHDSNSTNNQLSHLDEIEDYYTQANTVFREKLNDLSSRLQRFSDEHLDRLQSLSKTFSNY